MKRAPQLGFSLLELIVATAAASIIIGASVLLVAQMYSASASGLPAARRAATRDDIRAEFDRAADTGAKIAYHDLQQTMATIKDAIRSTGGGGSTGGPPPGYCLVVAGDPTTYPPGFNPRIPSTYGNVDWWEGVVRADPTTWYWNCGGSTGEPPKKTGALAPTPGTRTLTKTKLPTFPIDIAVLPSFHFGTGVRVGEALELVGPVGVWPAEKPAVAGQVGDAITLLRTDPQFAPFTLGQPFESATGVIRFVARDAADVEQVQALRAGDLLIVNGKSPDGTYVTALAELKGAFQQVSVPSVTGAGGTVLFKYFEAPTSAPGAAFAGGLRNSVATSGGTTIAEDAAVALLDRSGPVVTFCTAAGKRSTALSRITGDPAAPDLSEVLLEDSSSLAATLEWTSATSAPMPRPEDLQAVRLQVAVPKDDGAKASVEAIDVRVSFLNCATPSSATFHYRFLGEIPSGSGSGGGSK